MARELKPCGTEAAAETWRPVAGVSGYEVSDMGRVRGVDRTVEYRDGRVYRYAGQLLTPGRNPVSGYLHVALKGRSRNVHTLVLEAFVGLAPEGMECRHLNGDPSDARLSNLVWGTHSDNNRDQVRHGTHHLAARTHCLRGHLLAGANLRIRQNDGGRDCIACDRARSTCRKALANHGVVLDMQKVSDEKYAAIVAEAVA